MKQKFLLATLIISILMMCSGLTVGANKSSAFFKNQGESIESYNKIRNFNVDHPELNLDYPENYAGAYIDSEGLLNVNVVGKDESNLRNITNDDKIKYHLDTKYSMSYMKNVMEKITEKMVELGISGAGISDKDNKIFIYLEELDDAKINLIKKYIDTQAVEFKKDAGKLTYTTDVVNGSQAVIGTETMGVGFGARKNTGEIVFIVPGHVTGSVGSTVKYGGTAMGTLRQKNVGGTAIALLSRGIRQHGEQLIISPAVITIKVSMIMYHKEGILKNLGLQLA